MPNNNLQDIIKWGMWTGVRLCAALRVYVPETGGWGEVNKITTEKDLNVCKVRMCRCSVIAQQCSFLDHVSGEGQRTERLSAEDNLKGSHQEWE